MQNAKRKTWTWIQTQPILQVVYIIKIMLMINPNKSDAWPICNKSYQVINTSENVMSLTSFLFVYLSSQAPLNIEISR